MQEEAGTKEDEEDTLAPCYLKHEHSSEYVGHTYEKMLIAASEAELLDLWFFTTANE